MRALVKLKAEPGIWLSDVAEPVIGANDVLVKVNKTAICGTDIHIYNWDDWAQQTIQVPTTIGHEFVGTIAATGSAVSNFRVGDRVSGEGHMTCGNCRNCRAGRRYLCRNTKGLGVNRDGCFAEYVSIPAANAFLLPANIADDVAAIMDPLGNAVHTALSFNMVGEDVLITGAGPVGIMAVAVAKRAGARHIVVTDVNDYRLSLARKMGASRAVNVKQDSLSSTMQELGMTEGFDVGLEMSGNPQALDELMHYMNHGGYVAILGIPPAGTAIDWNQVIFKGLIIKGIYGREIFETWYKMTSLLQSGLDVSSVITHRLPVAEYQQAFDIMRSGQSGKVILNWNA